MDEHRRECDFGSAGQHAADCATRTECDCAYCCTNLAAQEHRLLASVRLALMSVSGFAWPYNEAADEYIECIRTDAALEAVDVLLREAGTPGTDLARAQVEMGEHVDWCRDLYCYACSCGHAETTGGLCRDCGQGLPGSSRSASNASRQPGGTVVANDATDRTRP